MSLSLESVLKNYETRQNNRAQSIRCNITNAIYNRWYPGCPSIQGSMGFEEVGSPPLAAKHVHDIIETFGRDGWVVRLVEKEDNKSRYFSVEIIRHD